MRWTRDQGGAWQGVGSARPRPARARGFAGLEILILAGAAGLLGGGAGYACATYPDSEPPVAVTAGLGIEVEVADQACRARALAWAEVLDEEAHRLDAAGAAHGAWAPGALVDLVRGSRLRLHALPWRDAWNRTVAGLSWRDYHLVEVVCAPTPTAPESALGREWVLLGCDAYGDEDYETRCLTPEVRAGLAAWQGD